MGAVEKQINVIIADDEPIARESIRILLSKEPSIKIVAECGDGKTTLEAISQLQPDLVFLDIQMPELTGFELLKKLNPEKLPLIIFVTAFDKFAIEAFECSAIDYLLKPYDDERFYNSLEKAKRQLNLQEAEKEYSKLEGVINYINNLQATTTYLKKLTLRANGKISFLSTGSILYVESEGNFVKIHSTSGVKIAGYTIKSLQQVLHPELFRRVHKSFIVNLDFIENLEPHFHGDYIIQMKNGDKIKLSRNYKEALSDILH